MKNRFLLFSSVFQIIVGTSAVAAFIVLAANGEPMGRWAVTLVLAVAYLVLGILGIRDCYKK